MDDEGLEGGNQISPTIMGAIERSRLSIVVFSENYGYSTWCLDELSKIIECVKTRNQMVWPIFYNVEKSDVCNQTKSYGEAMTEHENMLGKDSEKVQKWRSALFEAANLKGWTFETGYNTYSVFCCVPITIFFMYVVNKKKALRFCRYEYEVIEEIVERAIKI